MDWRTYSRTGRVYAAEIPHACVVSTSQGPVEARPGDFLVVDSDCTQVRHYSPSEFALCFHPNDRPVPLRDLPKLSGIAVAHVAEPSEERAGELCSRCGTHRTRREFEGVATCTECELALKAEREDRMSCPHDGAEMRKEVIEDVIVDRCPECGGTWFDGGELEMLSHVLRIAANQGLPSPVASRLFAILAHRLVE